MYGNLGDPERRRALHEDILRRARAQSNERVVALQLQQLASFARDDGRIQDALDMLKEGVRIDRDFGERDWVAVDLGAFAKTLVVAGRVERAATLLSASEALRAEIGGGVAWLPDENEETRTAVLAQLDEAAFAEAWEEGQRLTLDEAVALALDSAD